MKTIWKFKLGDGENQRIEMPKGAEILTVQIQGLFPHIWAVVDADEAYPTEIRNIEVIGTGVRLPEIDRLTQSRKYIGTFQQEPYVWHVFEIV